MLIKVLAMRGCFHQTSVMVMRYIKVPVYIATGKLQFQRLMIDIIAGRQ